jgi:hypothetical protein
MRFAALVAGVSLALASTSPGRAETPLERVLAKVREASGSPYAFHLRVTAGDGDAAQAVDLEGARSFAQRCDGIACRGIFFDGERTFATNFNGTALPADGPPFFDPSLQAVVLGAFASPDFQAAGGAVSLRDPVERDGVPFLRLRIRAPHGSPLDVSLDPQSFLVVRAGDDVRDVSFMYPAERGAGLPALPSVLSWGGPHAHAEPLRGWAIVPGTLERPAGLVPQFGAPAAVLKMLATSSGGMTPVVTCTIGGHSVNCLLDTGNSSLAMSLELAEQLDIEASSVMEVRGVGQYATGIAQGPEFSVGPVAFPAAKFALLHDIHRYGYDLVLGADVFARARVTLDYAKREVRFAPSDAPDEAPSHSAALQFEDLVPVAQVRLGDTPAALLLDSGDESTVNLSDAFYAANPALFATTGSTGVAGVGGSSRQLTGTIASVRIAGFELDKQRIGATQGLHATADGHLGSGFLAHFAVTFDYERARAEFAARSGDPAFKAIPVAP